MFSESSFDIGVPIDGATIKHIYRNVFGVMSMKIKTICFSKSNYYTIMLFNKSNITLLFTIRYVQINIRITLINDISEFSISPIMLQNIFDNFILFFNDQHVNCDKKQNPFSTR